MQISPSIEAESASCILVLTLLTAYSGCLPFELDNISTNDALESAKDKGALKSVIRHGPGDLRKELLQVIEKADNEIKGFFVTKTIAPLRPRVTVEYSTAYGVLYSDPCRLIEKEREQKIEARLFANAELTNKHSLSVVALKAKKVLRYFTEQLMTPTDKRRKEIIHEMSQELLQPNRYSMLLEIEGHNQSMPYENTSELSEFIGNLYGKEGWGELPNYFSMLHVYHYNEYTDEVVTSEGQLGGIEGWLNPVWTLHTTLMMKLMRIMEDVELISLAVYSDDVNGIFNIRQASKSSIQVLFEKITGHCRKFGMIVKISQTALSKHRVTMLRQHYADGQRADSTLKRVLSVSSANNEHVFSEELEVSGISSSASSALELSNNHEVTSHSVKAPNKVWDAVGKEFTV
ncbi:RNA-directed RNA polymerase L [Erysiphe necator]|nr:RNA-directed RNA polymerase L [Erysiphe necator]